METAAGFARFFALNGATLLAGLGFASRLRLQSRAQRLLAACVLAFGIANASGLVLGSVGHLRYGPLLAVQVVLAAAACKLARWRVMFDVLDPRPAAVLIRRPAERVALLVVAVAYGYVLFLGYLSETFAGDELMYHLPLVAEYARAGSISIPELGRYWGNRYWAYYPGGAYLVYEWFVLPFGTGMLVDLVQFPCAFATALASYVLARIAGARRGDAVWAAILFLAVPIAINQAKTALVDLTLSFLFASGLAFLLIEPLTPGGVLLAAIAWGAAPGVKLPAMLYLALGAACVALHTLDREKSPLAALRTLVPVGAAVALGVVLLSGYWFARNFLLMGSPVYPLNLRPEGPTSWSNVLVYGLVFPLLDFSPAEPEVFNYETGAGPQFIGLAVPALIAFGVVAARERRVGGIAFAALPLLAYGIWLLRLSTSVATLLRYVLPAMPLGFAAFSWLLSRVPRRSWLTGLALACVGFCFVVSVPRVGSYYNAESLRLGLAKWRRGEAVKRFDLMGSVDKQNYSRAWNYIDDLPGPHDIDVSHLIFAYPMMGADFRHQLHFIEETDPESWLAALRRHDIDRVAVAQFVNPKGKLTFGDALTLDLPFTPSGDEYFHVERNLEPGDVQALRLRYSSSDATNARLLVGVNRFQQVWDLPLPSPGETESQTIAWKGSLRRLDLVLDYEPRTRLRDEIQVALQSLEIQDADGRWTTLPPGERAEWEVLTWPIENYWMEAHPERFKLVMRDADIWRGRYSGEMRIYEVLPDGESDAQRR